MCTWSCSQRGLKHIYFVLSSCFGARPFSCPQCCPAGAFLSQISPWFCCVPAQIPPPEPVPKAVPVPVDPLRGWSSSWAQLGLVFWDLPLLRFPSPFPDLGSDLNKLGILIPSAHAFAFVTKAIKTLWGAFLISRGILSFGERCGEG